MQQCNRSNDKIRIFYKIQRKFHKSPYSVRIQKIRTRKNSTFGHFSRGESNLKNIRHKIISNKAAKTASVFKTEISS